MSALVRSFDPDSDDRPHGWDEAVERGAMAIYGVVTRTTDHHSLERKWLNDAKPLTRETHRTEAEACLRAAGWRR